MNVAVIYVEYNKVKYKHSFEKLRAYLQKMHFCNKVYIIVDNSQEGKKCCKCAEDVYWAEGDNEDREFSGWQRGVDLLYSLELPFHLVLFVNEAFEATGTSFLKKANFLHLWRALIFDNVIGSINSEGERWTVFHYDVSSWICTNCFFVSKNVLNSLGSLCTLKKKDIDDFLEISYASNRPLFKLNAPINESYEDHLVEWLTKGWHSKIVINRDTWGLFREKTRAILNEALLTARIREKNFHVKNYRILPYPPAVAAVIYKRIKKLQI